LTCASITLIAQGRSNVFLGNLMTVLFYSDKKLFMAL